MARKTENFCNNIIFKNYFADNNSKVLGNQNLQLMYDFDCQQLSRHAYLCSTLFREDIFVEYLNTSFRNFNIQNNRMVHPKVNEYL